MTVPPLDPRVVAEIRSLARGDAGVAEIWRAARPRLESRGLVCPSYSSVRRVVIEERRHADRLPEPVGPVGVDWVAGRLIVR